MAWEVGHKPMQDITAGYIILKQPIIEWSCSLPWTGNQSKIAADIEEPSE